MVTLVKWVVPPLLLIWGSNVFRPALLPVKIKVSVTLASTKLAGPLAVPLLVPVGLKLMAPKLPNVRVPEPLLEIVAVLLPMVNSRSVLTVPPVYSKVPLLAITRFVAALLDEPMPLLLPPLARTPTLSVPPLMSVKPL